MSQLGDERVVTTWRGFCQMGELMEVLKEAFEGERAGQMYKVC